MIPYETRNGTTIQSGVLVWEGRQKHTKICMDCEKEIEKENINLDN